MENTKLVVVFGAGASHDSIAGIKGDYVHRPPLTRQLFNPRYRDVVAKHRLVGTLIDDLRRLPTTMSLEAELDRIQNDEAPSEPTRRSELIALRYYLRDLLWDESEAFAENAPGATNYHVLLQRVRRWRDRTGSRLAFVTFNYDPLLDLAVEDVFPFDLARIEDYVAHEDVKVLRPHGSVWWKRFLATPLGDVNLDDNAAVERAIVRAAGASELQVDDEFTMSRSNRESIVGRRATIPAMTVPVFSKREFEFPEAHQSAFVEAVKDVVYLLVIGWRATEMNFLNLWAGAERFTQPRIQIVNRTYERGTEVLATLLDAGIRHSQYNAFEGGFSDFLAGDQLTRFLETPLPGLETQSPTF